MGNSPRGLLNFIPKSAGYTLPGAIACNTGGLRYGVNGDYEDVNLSRCIMQLQEKDVTLQML